MNTEFQTANAEELIHLIGSAIVNDPSYAGLDWAGIAFVCIIEPGGRRLSSYNYDEAGEASSASPKNRDIDVLFQQLQKATELDGKMPWKSALFQIKRAGMKVKVQFDYEDPSKWKATPENLSNLVKSLKPE